MMHARNAFACVAALMLTLLGCATTQPKSADTSILSVIDAIARQPTPREAHRHAQRLSNFVLSLTDEERDAVDPNTIACIAELLSTGDYAVRSYAAIALGSFGSKALPAVPLLERAGDEMQRADDARLVSPSQPSAAELYVAISKITGRTLCDIYVGSCRP